MADDLDSKAKESIEIAHDPSRLSPVLPVEAQIPRAGSDTPPIKNQYADSPATTTPVTSTHDRDSVQPPNPNNPVSYVSPEMPLKKKES